MDATDSNITQAHEAEESEDQDGDHKWPWTLFDKLFLLDLAYLFRSISNWNENLVNKKKAQ